MTSRSAFRSPASSSLARSLSMTASTPTRSPGPDDGYMVGMPPPPAQMTTAPRSSSQVIGSIYRIFLGSGEGTTRRQEDPSGLNVQPLAAASLSPASLE